MLAGGLEELLEEVARLVGDSDRPLAERLSTVARALADALEAERCWVCRVETDVIRTLAGVHMVLAAPDQAPLPLDKGLVGRVAREGRTLRVDDVLREPDYFAATALTRSEVAAPILRLGKAIGVLNVEANRVAAFGVPEQKVVEAVAELIAPYL